MDNLRFMMNNYIELKNRTSELFFIKNGEDFKICLPVYLDIIISNFTISDLLKYNNITINSSINNISVLTNSYDMHAYICILSEDGHLIFFCYDKIEVTCHIRIEYFTYFGFIDRKSIGEKIICSDLSPQETFSFISENENIHVASILSRHRPGLVLPKISLKKYYYNTKFKKINCHNQSFYAIDECNNLFFIDPDLDNVQQVSFGINCHSFYIFKNHCYILDYFGNVYQNNFIDNKITKFDSEDNKIYLKNIIKIQNNKSEIYFLTKNGVIVVLGEFIGPVDTYIYKKNGIKVKRKIQKINQLPLALKFPSCNNFMICPNKSCFMYFLDKNNKLRTSLYNNITKKIDIFSIQNDDNLDLFPFYQQKPLLIRGDKTKSAKQY